MRLATFLRVAGNETGNSVKDERVGQGAFGFFGQLIVLHRQGLLENGLHIHARKELRADGEGDERAGANGGVANQSVGDAVARKLI